MGTGGLQRPGIRQEVFVDGGREFFRLTSKAALCTIVPCSPFFLFVLQTIVGYKNKINAVEYLRQ